MASSYPMLRYGSSGQEVRRLQQALNRAGYSLEVDGGFGEKTRAALMDYQRRAGMTPDGVAGSKTWASLGLQFVNVKIILYGITALSTFVLPVTAVCPGPAGGPGEGVYPLPGDPGGPA